MSVRFEFILSDVDASNLMDIIHGAKCAALEKAQDFIKPTMSAADQANLDWYNGHAEYLEGLKQKVLAGNTRVE